MGQSTSCFQLSEADCIACTNCDWTENGCVSNATQADWNDAQSVMYYLGQLLIIGMIVILLVLKMLSLALKEAGQWTLSPLFDVVATRFL